MPRTQIEFTPRQLEKALAKAVAQGAAAERDRLRTLAALNGSAPKYLKAKDAAGHEHAADGKFTGPGGGGAGGKKPRPKKTHADHAAGHRAAAEGHRREAARRRAAIPAAAEAVRAAWPAAGPQIDDLLARHARGADVTHSAFQLLTAANSHPEIGPHVGALYAHANYGDSLRAAAAEEEKADRRERAAWREANPDKVANKKQATGHAAALQAAASASSKGWPTGPEAAALDAAFDAVADDPPTKATAAAVQRAAAAVVAKYNGVPEHAQFVAAAKAAGEAATKLLARKVLKAIPADDADPHHALYEALLKSVLDARAAGDDAAVPGLVAAYRDHLDDPELMASALAGAGGGETVAKAIGRVFLKAARWDKDKHPRDRNGRFISKDRIQEAATNPAVRKQLEAEVAPADAGKLEAAVADQGGTIGRTKRGEARHVAAQKREKRAADHKRAGELADKIAGGDASYEDMHELGDHLEGLTLDKLRYLQARIPTEGRGRRKADVVAALRASLDEQRKAAHGAELEADSKQFADAAGPPTDPDVAAAVYAGTPTNGVDKTAVLREYMTAHLAANPDATDDEVLAVFDRGPGAGAAKNVLAEVRGAGGAKPTADVAEQPQPATAAPQNWRDELKGKPRWQAVEVLRQREPHELTEDEFANLRNFDHGDDGSGDTTFRPKGLRGGGAAITKQQKEQYDRHVRQQWRDARDEAFIAGKAVSAKPEWATPQDEYVRASGNDVDDHRMMVSNALAAGKPVPPEVLGDYPDLAPATQSQEQPPAPAPVPPAATPAAGQSQDPLAPARAHLATLPPDGPAARAIDAALANGGGDPRRTRKELGHRHAEMHGEMSPEEHAGYVEMMAKLGVKPLHRVGETKPFDPETMASDTGLSTGTPVKVVRNGWSGLYGDEKVGHELIGNNWQRAKVEAADKPGSVAAEEAARRARGRVETENSTGIQSTGVDNRQGTGDTTPVPATPAGSNGGKPMTTTELPEIQGAGTYHVSGDTLTHKDAIKAAGGRWNGDKKRWEFGGKNAAAQVARVKDLPGLSVGTAEHEYRDELLTELDKYVAARRASGNPHQAKLADAAEAAAEQARVMTDGKAWGSPVVGGHSPAAMTRLLAGESSPDELPDPFFANHFIAALRKQGGVA